jgi:hypothetical protein
MQSAANCVNLLRKECAAFILMVEGKKKLASNL